MLIQTDVEQYSDYLVVIRCIITGIIFISK